MPAPNTPTKKIFLSYKSSDPKDRLSAARIKDLLEKIAPAAVKVFVSDENINAGKNWRKEIEKNIRCSDYLIFLYTDRSAHWEWCHFEAGLFIKASPNEEEEDKQRIFCIHPDTVADLPSPLGEFQHIKLPENKGRLREFLIELYVGEDPIRQLWLEGNEKLIDELAEKISSEVDRMAVNEKALCHYITLTGKVEPALGKGPKGEETASGIPDSYIVETNEESLEKLFGRSGSPKSGTDWTWGEVKPAGQHAWVSELATWMALYMRHSITTNPIRSFFKKEPGPDYSPILTKVNRRPDDYSFHVLFLAQSWEQRDRTDSVSSFKDLMERLVELIRSTEAGDTIRFLAYTPAIGFLAEAQELWAELEQCLWDKADSIDMICLNDDDLKRWHGRFEGKVTVRSEKKIDGDLIQKATEVSTKLLERLRTEGRDPVQKKFADLPGFYLFKNRKRALIVAPVGIPILDSDDSKKIGSEAKQSKVEMFGLDTNTVQIVKNAGLTFTRFR